MQRREDLFQTVVIWQTRDTLFDSLSRERFIPKSCTTISHDEKRTKLTFITFDNNLQTKLTFDEPVSQETREDDTTW